MEPESSDVDCAADQIDFDSDLDSGEMVPKVSEIVVPSESSSTANEDDDDDESLKLGDTSCPTEEPYYFSAAPTESVSKRYGREVSRYDIAFVRGAPLLMALWEGESHLAFGIGGQLRTVVDWYLLQKRDESAVSNREQIADPDRPDVPLWIEFIEVYGKEKIEIGTALQAADEALVPWLFMRNSNRVGVGVNTQFFWCADGPPSGYCTTVPILCRVIVDDIPVGMELFFDVGAVRDQYGWSEAAYQFAQECISRLDAGDDSLNVQYSIVHGRAPGQSWAYRGAPTAVSQYVELGQAEPPVAHERVRVRDRHGVVGKGVSSTSSRTADISVVGTSRRRGSGEDKVDALWRRAERLSLWSSMRLAAHLRIQVVEGTPRPSTTGGVSIWPSGVCEVYPCRV